MKRDNKEIDVLIIGGGPAGMMTALQASLRGKKVTLLEKNPALGKKLSITGGGRCNIANNESDVRTLLAHYGDASKYLFSAFSQFGLPETINFFEGQGLPLKTETGKRMFPVSEKAIDVVNFFKQAIKKTNIQVINNATVIQVRRNSRQGFVVTTAGGVTYKSNTLVIATGGSSRPETGSTGDGYAFARALGHTTFSASPDIVPLRTNSKDKWVFALAGTSLPNMKITFYQNEKKVFSKTGRLLFTHFGISGPTILNSAKRVGELLQGGVVDARVDIFPDTLLEVLEQNVIKIFSEHSNKTFRTVLGIVTPPGIAKALLSQVKIDGDTKVHSVTKEERRALIHFLKAVPIQITGRMGMDRAVVSDGGVPLDEIDTRTFESKKTKGLYIIGDMLNISRSSGGYSLQLCWTSGHTTGNSV